MTITSTRGTHRATTLNEVLDYLVRYQPADVAIDGEPIEPTGDLWGEDTDADLMAIADAIDGGAQP